MPARAPVWVTLVDGLRLYGEGERVPAGSAVGAGRRRRQPGGRRPGDGLRAASAARSACTAPSPARAATAAASRRALHVSAERGPELVGPAYVVRVSLEGLDDDRAFVALVRGVRALAADKPVAAVLFKIENVELGTARIEELRGLMAFLRAHGKRVFAYAPSPSTREYYLASAADAIVLHPAGELALTGLSQSVTFYKRAMDRLGVHVDLVRIGSYKGAMEPFVMTEQSPDVRANKTRLLDDVFDRIMAAIAADRTRVGQADGRRRASAR